MKRGKRKGEKERGGGEKDALKYICTTGKKVVLMTTIMILRTDEIALGIR